MGTDVSDAGQWDAICVGAGITSLAFGAQVVARHPRARILVIDKHTAAGGYATQFTRPKAGAVFDCSLHKLTGTRTDGNLKRIFDELGLTESLEMIAHPDHFEACLPGQSLILGNSPAAVRQTLLDRFPQDRDGICQFFAEVEVHGRNSYYQFQIMSGDHDVDFKDIRYAHRHLKNITVAEAVAARVQDGHLREILAAPSIYVGGFAEDLSYLYFLHVVYASLYLGNAYVSGSSQQISDLLAQRIRDAGGEVLLGTRVSRIHPAADGKGHVVETLRGSFRSDQVYLNAAPHHVLNELFEATPVLEPIVQRLERLTPSRSTTTLYLTTDLPPAELGLTSAETMVFALPQEASIAARQAYFDAPEEAKAELAFWAASPMEVTNYHSLDPSGGCVVCINVLDTMAHWPVRKSKEYKAKKLRAVEVLLARLFAAKPGLRGHILYSELATPRTCERFTNNTEGAGFGALVGTNATGHLFHHAFPFPGIHFLSAWVAGGGYETAFGYAEMKARQWPASGAALAA
jgi:phytoene dehydrogenase-like protein